jgi:hypothetical protein
LITELNSALSLSLNHRQQLLDKQAEVNKESGTGPASKEVHERKEGGSTKMVLPYNSEAT